MCMMRIEVMEGLSGAYSRLLASQSAEVQIRWLQMVVRSNYPPEIPAVRSFLHKHVSTHMQKTFLYVHDGRIMGKKQDESFMIIYG